MSERADSIERLRRLAERTLDAVAYERIVLPAIADVRHECDGRASPFVTMRAHWGLWKTLAVCLLIESGRVAGPTVRGVAARTAIIFAIVCSLLMIIALDDGDRAGIGKAAFLQFALPQAAGAALLVAYYFAVVFEPETIAPRRLLPAVFAMSLVCSLVMAAITTSIVPRTTTSFLDASEAALRATLPPGELAARPTVGRQQEWTFTTLVRKSVGRGSPEDTALARRTLSNRLAVSTMPIMAGFVGLAVSGYRTGAAFFNGAWVLILYVAAGRAFAQSSTMGPTTEHLWLINGVFTLAGVCLVVRRTGGTGGDTTLLYSP